MDPANRVPPPVAACRLPQPWVNWGGTQEVFPKRIERPLSLAELQEIVRKVSASSGRMKAVATGLSFSDILQSDDTLVEVVSLLGEPPAGVFLPLEEELWRRPRPAVPLVRIICGARIRPLNSALHAAGLAFTNLGGYDQQTMVGAISTSTHGSGLTLGPLGDAVRSLDLVTTDGKLFRIEPTEGITDRAAFDRRYKGSMELLQSDDIFWSVVVSMGCMGVIYSVTMEVSPAYRLREQRRLRRWSEVRCELATGRPLRDFRNYEVLLNPYKRHDDDFTCLVTERNVAVPHAKRIPLPDGRRNAESVTFLASSQAGILRLMTETPRLVPGILEAGLSLLVSAETVDDSFRIYNVGKINTADVVSAEYFFPVNDGSYLRAVTRMLDIVQRNQEKGIYQTSPLSLRFVAGSKAPLSMTRGEPHCAMEISLFRGMPYAIEMLMQYEQACVELGGRPHWGQLHLLTGHPGWLRRAYPRLDTWLSAYASFNGKGIFNNHFTDRLGISMPLESRV